MDRSSRGQVDPFIVMDMVAEAAALEAAGRSIIHMEVGQPSTPAPKGAIAALSAQMGRDALGYSVSLGLPALRQGIAALYKRWYGVDLNPDRVVVTSGSSGAFFLAFNALF
jgi:aspartate/methionine/tyrosine aminotransferase